MVVTKRIAVGLRVAGKHGPLVDNPSGGKRRVRETAYGTVIRAVEKGQWEVRFDYDRRRKQVKNTTLKVVNNDAGISLEDLDKAADATVLTTASTRNNSDTSTTTESIGTGVPLEMVRTFVVVFEYSKILNFF